MRQVRMLALTFSAALLLSACADPATQPASAADAQIPPSSAAAGAELAATNGAATVAMDGSGDAVADAADLAGVESSIKELLGDPATFRDVFNRLQAGVAAGDKAAVAALVDYPLGVTFNGKPHKVANAAGFVADWDRIMTPEITRVISNQQYDQVFVNFQGVMLGDGQVWINAVCRTDDCATSDVRVTALQGGPQ